MNTVASGLATLALLLLLASPGVEWARAEEPAGEDAEAEYLEALEKALDIEESLMRAVRKVRPYSVSVINKRYRGRGDDRVLAPAGVGSGVLVSYRGKLWIVTNVHVIDRHDGLDIVTHDGKTHAVEEHDSIPAYDIALLFFKEKVRAYKGVRVDRNVSKNKLREGTWVIATGNPFTLALDGSSVTTLGVVSGLDRYLGGRFQYVGAIQHDAEVNPGNSGGPLWNVDGKLIGINGKIAMNQQMQGAGPSNTGASFSLPIHQVDAFLALLTRPGDAQAGFLGITTETAKDDDGKPIGARITKIDRRSPVNGTIGSKRPQPGDVIVKLEFTSANRYVYTATDFRRELSLLPSGTKVTVRFKRKNRAYAWTGKLGGS